MSSMWFVIAQNINILHVLYSTQHLMTLSFLPSNHPLSIPSSTAAKGSGTVCPWIGQSVWDVWV